jgi:hypothetical protein
MPTPAVLLLATPIFGLSLSISPELATPSFVRGTLAFDVAGSAVVAAAEEGEAPEEDAAALMAKRARIARVHRALGISTWAAMTWTVILGTIQYRNLYGLICRYVDNQNFYFLIVASDGYYAIGKSVNGEYDYIDTEFMEETDAVLGGDATNHIRADCSGSTLRLYANGNLLKEVNDATFTTGDIGLIAGTFDNVGVDILFDNVVVRAP